MSIRNMGEPTYSKRHVSTLIVYRPDILTYPIVGSSYSLLRLPGSKESSTVFGTSESNTSRTPGAACQTYLGFNFLSVCDQSRGGQEGSVRTKYVLRRQKPT